MAVLKVAKLGSPVLRRRAVEIESADLKRGRLRHLFDDLLETMVEYDGTGLAAPQVNQGLRVVLYEVNRGGADAEGGAEGDEDEEGEAEASPSGLVIPPRILVNPSFEVLDPTEVDAYEGCLSVPFLAAKVPRPKKIRVRALDRHGKAIDFVAEDFHARVVLHESDHLDGVVYLDRVKDKASIRYTVDF